MKLFDKGIWRKAIKFRGTKFILLIIILVALLALKLIYSNDGSSGEKINSWLPTLKKVEKVDISAFGLDVAKIDVWAPIVPQVDGYNKDTYLKAIEKGVAQFKDTKNPDEAGNLFVFGHSEYYKDKPGDYKEVFKRLNEIKKGDKFNVYYKGIKYDYEATESKKVDQYDWSIMDPTPENGDDKTITLMTCWPPGTLDARWVVFAKQN